MSKVISLEKGLDELKRSYKGARYERVMINEVKRKLWESYTLYESFLEDNYEERTEEMEVALKSFKNLILYFNKRVRKLDDNISRKKEMLGKLEETKNE